MADKNNDLKSLLKNKTVPAAPTGKKYNYRKIGLNGKSKALNTYSIDPEIEDKIFRDAYWNRNRRSTIVNHILREYYKDKDFDEIPPEAYKTK